MKPVPANDAPRAPRVREIIAAACAEFDLSIETIKRRSREQKFVRPRQIAMYLALADAGKSLSDVGMRFGGFDHSTVIYARNKVQRLLSSGDIATASAIRGIRARYQR